MTVSIIVPVYNVAPYLRDCLCGLLTQRFRDFEVLLIDDGSTDGSGQLCDELAEKDSRVVVLHQKNGGVCSARNRGIDEARGEFLVFVDADDVVTGDYLEHLMDSDADLVLTGVHKFGALSGTRVPARRDDFGIEGLAARWNIPPDMNFLYCYPVAKRFRTRIIREHGIRFNETLRFSEDMCFNMEYYYYAESFTELPFADYGYRIFDMTREEKYRMSATELETHHESLEACFCMLYKRIGAGTLSSVRDNTNLRLIRKFYAFLMQKDLTLANFVRNVKSFRDKNWARYMVGLLQGKKEKRVFWEAVRFPVWTYWVENRLNHALSHFSKR